MKIQVTLLAVLVLAACGQQNEAPSASTPASAVVASQASSPASAPASAPVAASESVSDNQTASAASDTAELPAISASSAAASGNVTKSCDAYLKRVQNCFDKVGKETAAVYEQGTEVMKQSLAGATPSQQDEICKMSNETFNTTAKKLKCE